METTKIKRYQYSIINGLNWKWQIYLCLIHFKLQIASSSMSIFTHLKPQHAEQIRNVSDLITYIHILMQWAKRTQQQNWSQQEKHKKKTRIRKTNVYEIQTRRRKEIYTAETEENGCVCWPSPPVQYWPSFWIWLIRFDVDCVRQSICCPIIRDPLDYSIQA